jgi:hypothetical protein
MSEWPDELNIKITTIRERIRRGWTIETVLNLTPLRVSRECVTGNSISTVVRGMPWLSYFHELRPRLALKRLFQNLREPRLALRNPLSVMSPDDLFRVADQLRHIGDRNTLFE